MARILVLGSFDASLVSFRGVMLQEMVALGHQVFACAPDASKEVRNALSNMGVVYQNIELDRTGMNLFHDIRSLIQLIGLFKKIKPDVFLGYTIKPVIYGSFAARISDVPGIFSMITGLGYAFSNTGIKNRVTGFIAQQLYGLALSFNRNVFFQNPDDMNLFKAKGLLKGKDKAVLINGSGIDLEVYRSAPYPEKFTLLLIARLIKDKGIFEYIEAARIIREKFPEVRFNLVGFIDKNPSAISEYDLQNWVKNGTIKYLGRLSDVRPAIADSSVYILPSYREGTPRSVLEAMAMSRPVITTDTPGCRETVVDGENGFLIPVKNVQKLVEAIEYFINNPADIESMGKVSRQMAEEKYDVHKVNAVIFRTMDLL